ncbi:ORF6N domain-containing protein [Chryseolinea lacunae]|uniref:ORF6N domain-containing protein n=1 Tax=Chryseolinea lacunae TaxID=2801331 RepID=A0ABS1KVC2_9BACT|nr:ORF6N domain-containing protein [Chryseolinea lacunae]MBL0743414.1 ORF6N domain-containing protein [Chryseolinea lacunae]
MSPTSVLPEEHIFQKIYVIHDQKVLLDADLSKLYGVPTKVLKQAVKRNRTRFPPDFMFELSPDEWEDLRSQIVTSSWGGSRYVPMAFTEQGVAMLSSVLKSPQAIDVNIQIMRVFVKMRQLIMSYKDLLARIESLETAGADRNKHIRNIYALIKELLEPAAHPRPIGFKTNRDKD